MKYCFFAYVSEHCTCFERKNIAVTFEEREDL